MKYELELSSAPYIRYSDLSSYEEVKGLLRKVDVGIEGHVGNLPSVYLEFEVENYGKVVVTDINNIASLGVILRDIVWLLDLTKDGLMMSDIKNVPVKLFMDSITGKVHALGHSTNKHRISTISDLIGR